MGTIWTDLLGAQVRYVGTRFRTRVIEAGPDNPHPLVFLHGNGGHAEAFSRNVVPLGRRFHTIAVDLLWHGYSSTPPYEAPLPQYCAQLIDLLDTLGIERASFEGESLGGWVSMWMGLHHPDRVHKLILNTPAGVKVDATAVKVDVRGGRDTLRERSIAAIDHPDREYLRKRLEWLMADPARVTDELVDTRLAIYTREPTRSALRVVFANSFGAGLGEAYRIAESELKGIAAPTLVLWTDKNPGVGPDAGRRIASLIPNAVFECIDDAAHWPQWEQPERHDEIVTRFLEAS